MQIGFTEQDLWMEQVQSWQVQVKHMGMAEDLGGIGGGGSIFYSAQCH